MGRREVPALDDVVPLAAGSHRLGEPGEERDVVLPRVLIGRYPVVNAQLAAFARATGRPATRKQTDAQLADHPATDVTRADAEAFCAWLSASLRRAVRLPRGDEWEAVARGGDARPWPWGDTFDETRCACAESGWGWTVPVGAHPARREPARRRAARRQRVGVGRRRRPGRVGRRPRGSYLDTGWGLRACRVQPADPERATATTGFRIAIDEGSSP